MARKITVTLTVPQTEALLSVAAFGSAGEPEGWDPAVLDRARVKLTAALDKEG
jgi:hypothetical protein